MARRALLTRENSTARQRQAPPGKDPIPHASRNTLLCDAGTRIVTMAHSAGAITGEEAAMVRHPHACPEIGQAPPEEDLDALFPRREQNRSLWGSIRSSLSSLGDFADYEVRPAVHHFSMLPLTSNCPRRPLWQRRDDPVAVDTTRIPAFAASLPESVRPALTTPAAVTQLLTGWTARQVLDQDQYALLQNCKVPSADDERLADTRVDAAWAARWILARVADLGWSPDLFAEFDNFRGRMSGSRQPHKGERIGKKYQWMALHELVERLANHHHPHRHSEDDPAEYPGAARLSLLDIDPTLPPARHPIAETDNEEARNQADHATFPPANPADPLAPPIPALPDDDGIDAWIKQPGDLPCLEELGVRVDSEGREWVVRATDPAGQPVAAIPATQTYNWSSQSSDCSLDAPVSVTLLSDPLLRGSGLQRDPDRPLWYDAEGRLHVQYLSWDRPTGTASSLLVSREWLEQRLQRLGFCLVQRMLGERQTVTPEHPRIWREFSQAAGHTAQGQRTPGTTVTVLRRSFR